ncbi:MAG: protein kinase [Muribaculaceae bacterium]|nr:protein kinase [Muribaculaceae bacterium]
MDDKEDNIKFSDPSGKWTEIEHLPEWDEKFYHVYTAKKFGKWVMMKTLRPEYKDDPDMRAMIEKEFEVRYNLASPNIIMINDFDEVPGVGKAIITDDVYGDSLAKLIEKGQVDESILIKVNTSLLDALDYIQQNHIVHHCITPERIIFTENVRNLKVIDVGFDQHDHLSRQETEDDIIAFGKILQLTIDACSPEVAQKHSRCRKVAQNAIAGRYADVQELKMALNNRNASRLGIFIAVFLVIMIVALAWLTSLVRNV